MARIEVKIAWLEDPLENTLNAYAKAGREDRIAFILHGILWLDAFSSKEALGHAERMTIVALRRAGYMITAIGKTRGARAILAYNPYRLYHVRFVFADGEKPVAPHYYSLPLALSPDFVWQPGPDFKEVYTRERRETEGTLYHFISSLLGVREEGYTETNESILDRIRTMFKLCRKAGLKREEWPFKGQLPRTLMYFNERLPSPKDIERALRIIMSQIASRK